MVSNLKTAFTPPRGAFLSMYLLSLIEYLFSRIGKKQISVFGTKLFFQKSYLLFTLFLLNLIFIYKHIII